MPDFKAVVITDSFDDVSIKKDLYSILENLNIPPLEYSTLDDLDKDFSNLDINTRYLFFPNIYIRYKHLTDIIKVHSLVDFDYIYSKVVSPPNMIENSAAYTVSFIPKNVKVTRDSVTLYRTEDIIQDRNTFGYSDSNLVEFKKPNVSIPRIILYTHNRDIYLKNTLYSLMNSLSFCPEIPVTLIGNKPTPEVQSILQDFQNRYSQIEVLLCEDNVAFAAQSIGIMWHKPENVIMAEDDFILPSATKYLYPIWPYQFAQKLEHCEFVGWSAMFNNLSFNLLTDWQELVPKTRLGWFYWERGSGKVKPILMCQLSCFKSKMWQRGYNEKLRGC